MYLIIASFVLFLIIIFMLIFNKRLARFAYKDIQVSNISSYNYCKQLYNKQAKKSGTLPIPFINQFYLNNAFFIIKNKIIKNKPLDKIEKILFESKEFIKRNYIKNTIIFDNVLYINDYCRVMLIAKAVLLENNYKINSNDIEKYIEKYNLALTYNEILAIKEAFKYQIIVEFSKCAKYIIYHNKMKNKSKKRFSVKYIDSTVYCYYYGKYTNNFEMFNNELLKQNINFDNVVSEYFRINNYYIQKFYNLIQSLTNVEKLNNINLYIGNKLLENNYEFCKLSVDKKRDLFSKIAFLSNVCKVSENIVILALIEYSKIMNNKIEYILEENTKQFNNYVIEFGNLTPGKKKF